MTPPVPDARALAALAQLRNHIDNAEYPDEARIPKRTLSRWLEALSAPAPPESPELVAAERRLVKVMLEPHHNLGYMGNDVIAAVRAVREAKGGR